MSDLTPRGVGGGVDDGELFVTITELNPKHRNYHRLRELGKFFAEEFGTDPDFYVRVPGRVNIIGEHVDYCGYPVLPMAIDQSIVLAVGQTQEDKKLHLRNIQKTKFKDYTCDLESISIEIPQAGGPQWYNYYLCGVKGIHDVLAAERLHTAGIRIALSGNIPPASGLSSSSALVSAAALATAHVLGLPLDRKHLASISACCERYIGTQGGGMDQAIAYLAKDGCAQFIEFHPKLQGTPIALPSGACFVVANSLAEKNKAASSDFNERVVECRLGARWLAKCSEVENWRDVTRFIQLQEELHLQLDALEELAKKCFPKAIYTRDEVCQALNVTDHELETQFLTANTRHMQQFKLRQRALHVIQESLRVAKFRTICEQSSIGEPYRNGNGFKSNGDHIEISTSAPPHLSTLSDLMRQSHRSLKELYECSHPDLDRLVAISEELGVGARLTGAGWGGCVVALCDSIESSVEFIRVLKEKYFSHLPPHLLEQHQSNDFSDVVFATFPCNGAELLVARV